MQIKVAEVNNRVTFTSLITTNTNTMKNFKDLKKADLNESHYGYSYYGYCLSKVARNYFRVYLSSLTSDDYNDGTRHATGNTNKEKSILFDNVEDAILFLENNKGTSSFNGYEIERISLTIK